jgi:site-specific DNA recombinase
MDREHMRLLLAARLSKKVNSNDEGLGIETQDKRGREWAERQGHTIVAVAADTKRGTIAPWDRPNLRPWVTRPDLMAKYDGILAYKNDRLSRGSWDDETRIRQWASQNDKVLVIVDGPQWPPRDDGDFWSWTAQAKQANAEWVEICERTQRAIDELIDRKKLVGRPPWGYESIGEKYDHTLAPSADGREFVPQIFQRVADGDSLMELAKWLDSQGAKPSQAKSWSPKSVAKIIRTRTYMGTRLQGGRVPMAVEKLVDAKLWERANKRLDNAPVGRRAPSNGKTALLTGVLFCARCNAPMYRIKAYGGLHYRCSGHHPQRKGCGNMIPLEVTDSLAVQMLSQASEPWTELVKVDGENHDIELAEVKLAIRDLAAQDLPDSEYDAKLAELRAERDRLAALPNVPDEWKPIDTGRTVGQHFAALDLDGKRAMLLEEVKLYAEKSPADSPAPGYPVLVMRSRLFTIPHTS